MLNNETSILLNLAEYPLILVNWPSAPSVVSEVSDAISQDNIYRLMIDLDSQGIKRLTPPSVGVLAPSHPCSVLTPLMSPLLLL